MSGERDLNKLLKSMSPGLIYGEYVFCSFPGANYGDHSDLKPIASFSEQEGLTLILPKPKADKNGINYDSVFRGITLHIHSSLETVGLTAAISTALANHGISANVVAAYYHDHIFVQNSDADKAVQVLREFAR